MKQQLTNDQKIQIAQIAVKMTELAINNTGRMPVNSAISTQLDDYSNDAVFLAFYDIVEKKIIAEPEHS